MYFNKIIRTSYNSLVCLNQGNEYNKGSKPNFIFYLSDDQDRWDYEIYGNPLLKEETSAVTKLASEGMVFNNFYTPVSTCAPSRSVLYTGINPVKNGAFLNHNKKYLKIFMTQIVIKKYLIKQLHSL